MANNNGKRMVKEDLLNYLEAVQTNYPDPSDIGGGGSSYSAGTGINITNDVISVDSTVVALKSDLLDYVTTSELATELSNYVTSTDLAAELLDYAELSDLATVATTGSYNDLSNKPDLSVYAKLNDDTQNITANNITVTPGAGYIHTTYGPTTIAMSIPRTPGYTITIPTKDGTMALTSDIPSLTGYATESWVTNQGYSTFSGSYNDLTNKPTIPDAVSGTNDGANWTSLTIGNTTYNIPSGGGSSYSAGTGINITNDVISVDSTVVALKSDIPSLTDYAKKAWVTSQGYATEAWVIGQGYSTFSGSYNDLTNKPSIPTISGDYDSSYWTSLTINGRSRSIPSTSGCVTVNTNQNITGTKTFVGKQLLKFKQNASNDTLGFTAYDNNNNEIGNLQIARRSVDGSLYNYTNYVTLGNFSTQNEKAKVGFRIQPNNSQYSYNFVMPYGTNANFNANTYATNVDTTIPCAFTDGTTIVKADATGLVNISSISGGGSGGTTVSGTNDGTNWTSITIGSDTYGIPSGGGGSSSSSMSNYSIGFGGDDDGTPWSMSIRCTLKDNSILVPGIYTSFNQDTDQALINYLNNALEGTITYNNETGGFEMFVYGSFNFSDTTTLKYNEFTITDLSINKLEY